MILYQQRKRLKLPTNEILKMNTASMYTSVYNHYTTYFLKVTWKGRN